jgi:hypothetical protein
MALPGPKEMSPNEVLCVAPGLVLAGQVVNGTMDVWSNLPVKLIDSNLAGKKVGTARADK